MVHTAKDSILLLHKLKLFFPQPLWPGFAANRTGSEFIRCKGTCNIKIRGLVPFVSDIFLHLFILHFKAPYILP